MKKLFIILNEFSRQLKRDNIAAYASGTAFFFFLSIVPILMIVFSIIKYTPLTEEMLVTLLNDIVPVPFKTIAVSFVEQMYRSSGSVIPIAVIIALWSAGKGMMGLQMGLNVAHGVVETRNIIVIRLQASFYTLITLVAILLTFVLSLFTQNFTTFVAKYAPELNEITGFLGNYRSLFGLVILTLLFSVIYKFVPNKKLRMRYQIPGALFAAVGWQIFSYLFSLYLKYFNPASIYGSLSTIIVVLFWLYFSMYLFLIGANLNRYFKPVIKVFIKTRNKAEKTEKV